MFKYKGSGGKSESDDYVVYDYTVSETGKLKALFGQYYKGKLYHISGISNFSKEDDKEIRSLLSKGPFVIEIGFQERQPGGLRHQRFLRFRADKNPKDATMHEFHAKNVENFELAKKAFSLAVRASHIDDVERALFDRGVSGTVPQAIPDTSHISFPGVDFGAAFKVMYTLESGGRSDTQGDAGTSLGLTQMHGPYLLRWLARDSRIGNLGLSGDSLLGMSDEWKSALKKVRQSDIWVRTPVDQETVADFVARNPKSVVRRLEGTTIKYGPDAIIKKTSGGYVKYMLNYDVLRNLGIDVGSSVVQVGLRRAFQEYITDNVLKSTVAQQVVASKMPDDFAKFKNAFSRQNVRKNVGGAKEILDNASVSDFAAKVRGVLDAVRQYGYDTTAPGAFNLYQLITIANGSGLGRVQQFLKTRQPFGPGNLTGLRRANPVIERVTGMASAYPDGGGLGGFSGTATASLRLGVRSAALRDSSQTMVDFPIKVWREFYDGMLYWQKRFDSDSKLKREKWKYYEGLLKRRINEFEFNELVMAEVETLVWKEWGEKLKQPEESKGEYSTEKVMGVMSKVDSNEPFDPSVLDDLGPKELEVVRDNIIIRVHELQQAKESEETTSGTDATLTSLLEKLVGILKTVNKKMASPKIKPAWMRMLKRLFETIKEKFRRKNLAAGFNLSKRASYTERGTLYFPGQYADDIKSGKRRMTIRIDDVPVEVNEIVTCMTYSGTPICEARVTDKSKMSLTRIEKAFGKHVAKSLEQKFGPNRRFVVVRFEPFMESQADDKEDKEKFKEILIDKEGISLTRGQIRDHYVRPAIRKKIMSRIKGKPVLVYIGVDKNESILKRNHGGKPIVIMNDDLSKDEDPNNYFYWVKRRLLSIHQVFGTKTDIGFVDLDLHGDFPLEKAKKYAKDVSARLKKEFDVAPVVYQSGGTGLHVEFKLDKEVAINTLRTHLKELLDDLNNEWEGVTTGVVKGSGLRSDISTLHNKGSLRVPGSLGETYGREKKPFGEDSAADWSDSGWADPNYGRRNIQPMEEVEDTGAIVPMPPKTMAPTGGVGSYFALSVRDGLEKMARRIGIKLELIWVAWNNEVFFRKNVENEREVPGVNHLFLMRELEIKPEYQHRIPRGFITFGDDDSARVTTYGESFYNLDGWIKNTIINRFDLMPGKFHTEVLSLPRGVSASASRGRILMLVASKDFYELEFSVPQRLFSEKFGFSTAVASDGFVAVGANGTSLRVDVPISDPAVMKVDAREYAALFVVGGKGMVAFSKDKGAQKLLKSFVRAKKPIAMICHAPLLAAESGIARGREVTGGPEIEKEMRGAKAVWTGMPVERDGLLFTAIGPDDAENLAYVLGNFIIGRSILGSSKEQVLTPAKAAKKLVHLWKTADLVSCATTEEEFWLKHPEFGGAGGTGYGGEEEELVGEEVPEEVSYEEYLERQRMFEEGRGHREQIPEEGEGFFGFSEGLPEDMPAGYPGEEVPRVKRTPKPKVSRPAKIEAPEPKSVRTIKPRVVEPKPVSEEVKSVAPESEPAEEMAEVVKPVGEETEEPASQDILHMLENLLRRDEEKTGPAPSEPEPIVPEVPKLEPEPVKSEEPPKTPEEGRSSIKSEEEYKKDEKRYLVMSDDKLIEEILTEDEYKEMEKEKLGVPERVPKEVEGLLGKTEVAIPINDDEEEEKEEDRLTVAMQRTRRKALTVFGTKLVPPKDEKGLVLSAWPELGARPKMSQEAADLFSEENIMDDRKMSELFNDPATWGVLEKESHLLQSWILPAIILSMGRKWFNINKVRTTVGSTFRRVGNTPFSMFDKGDGQALRDNEDMRVEDLPKAKRYIQEIIVLATEHANSYFSTREHVLYPLGGWMKTSIERDMKRIVAEANDYREVRYPLCSVCRRLSPKSKVIEHMVASKVDRKTFWECPECKRKAEALEATEIPAVDARIKDSEDALAKLRGRENQARIIIEDVEDEETKAKALASIKEAQGKIIEHEKVLEGLRQKKLAFAKEHELYSAQLRVPRQHTVCPNEACPGQKVPLTAIDWENSFWDDPVRAKEIVANLYRRFRIVPPKWKKFSFEVPVEQDAEEGVEQLIDPRYVAPQWMDDVPFVCPHDGVRFTLATARGKGYGGAAGFLCDPWFRMNWKSVGDVGGADIAEEEISSDTDANELLAYRELGDLVKDIFFKKYWDQYAEFEEVRKQILLGKKPAHERKVLGMMRNMMLYDTARQFMAQDVEAYVGWLAGRELTKKLVMSGERLERRVAIENNAEAKYGEIYLPILQGWVDRMLGAFGSDWQKGFEAFRLQEWLVSSERHDIPSDGPGTFFFAQVEPEVRSPEKMERGVLPYGFSFDFKSSGLTRGKSRAAANARLLRVLGIWKVDESEVSNIRNAIGKFPGFKEREGKREFVPSALVTKMVAGKSNRIAEMASHDFHRVALDRDATDLMPGDHVLVQALVMPGLTKWSPLNAVRDLRKDSDSDHVFEEFGELAMRNNDNVEFWRKFSIVVRGIKKRLGHDTRIENAKIMEVIKHLNEKHGKVGTALSLRAARKDPLSTYKKKRRFDKTPEPEGEVGDKNKHRFVIQLHHADVAGEHYDLRLENDEGALSSWAVPKHKLPAEKEKLLAMKTEDHPLSYIKFKGTIPEGYGAGEMEIHDSGTYEEIERTKSKLVFKLRGGKEKGTYVLFNTGGKRWLLMRSKKE
jgi:DNA ligase D-like protein (predicted 3'-phosphoesterase)